MSWSASIFSSSLYFYTVSEWSSAFEHPLNILKYEQFLVIIRSGRLAVIMVLLMAVIRYGLGLNFGVSLFIFGCRTRTWSPILKLASLATQDRLYVLLSHHQFDTSTPSKKSCSRRYFCRTMECCTIIHQKCLKFFSRILVFSWCSLHTFPLGLHECSCLSITLRP